MAGGASRGKEPPSRPAPTGKSRRRRGRPAVSGMIEAFILIGIAVGGVAALAVWFGGFGEGGTVWTNAHCTLSVDGREGVGGGKNYIEVTVRNTGGVDINGFEVAVGDSFAFSHSGRVGPGETETKFNVTSAPFGSGNVFAEAVATYADGSTTVCDRVRSFLTAGG